MPQYIFAYHGGKSPESEAEGARMMAAWKSWMEGLGSGLVVPGNPVGLSKTVHHDGVDDDGGANPISGYSVVEAADLHSACAMAKGCPLAVDGDGTVEVAELMEM
ncbi:YciI family protein [Phaeobacter sp.]|uniref:YciI family protein n=1 Tax=Phaeobacter sp. TaxID=1902409 RepID=UPI0025D90740|nr:YciI family protein [Phaeobacter sp.]